jgi:hypothetical protein
MKTSEFVADRERLRQRLRHSPPASCAAFAAACAERLLPAYEDHCAKASEDPVLLAPLSSAWGLQSGTPALSGAFPQSLWEDWNRGAIPQQGAAQDAAIAILYAFRAAMIPIPEEDSAFHAANSITDALAANVMNSLGISDYGQRYEDEVLSSWAVRDEVARQWRDLEELEKATEPAWASTVNAIRTRAKRERIELAPDVRRAEPHVNPFTGKRLPRG